MIKLRDISIKHSCMIIAALIVLPIMAEFYIMTYRNIKEGIIQNAQVAVAQSKDGIIETIKISEKSYELASQRYDAMMRESLDMLRHEYQDAEGDVSSIDIQRIKDIHDKVIDIYIINEDGVIEYSTFSTAIGIDFREVPDFYDKLSALRLGEKIEIANVTSDIRTRELRKWGYAPSPDHKYVLEVGVLPQELKKHVKQLDYIEMSNNLKTNNPFIKEVYVYDRQYFKLGYETKEESQEKQRIIDQVLQTGREYRSYGELGLVAKEYILVDTFKGSRLDDSKKVIEIEYNHGMVINILDRIQKSTVKITFVYTAMSLLGVMFITGIYIAAPLENLAQKVGRVSWNNLGEISEEYEWKNELGVLYRSFSQMSRKLSDTIISKRYLENIIDSVGDIFMVLDRDFAIRKLSRHTLEIFGVEREEIIGKPVEELFGSLFPRADIAKELWENGEAENVEHSLECPKRGQMVLISSFSALYDEDMRLIGYSCSSKDISNTKKAICMLEDMNMKLIENESVLMEKSTKDDLTGIFNRGHIFEKLNEVVRSIPGRYSTLSIIMCDVDHFKRINDGYGHQMGDYILKGTADIIRDGLRSHDYVGRYGGEEFLIVLPDSNLKNAVIIAERIRTAVESYRFNDTGIGITVSAGVAEYEKGSDFSDTINNADRLLYEAKKNGRNRVEF